MPLTKNLDFIQSLILRGLRKIETSFLPLAENRNVWVRYYAANDSYITAKRSSVTSQQQVEQAVILGCGYVGQAVARHWYRAGLHVTATTTTPKKASQLEAIASRAVVIRGDDAPALVRLLADQDVLLVSISASAASGRQNYRDSYLATAETLAQVLPYTALRQVIYTSSFGVYGNHGGHWVTEETAIAPTTTNNQVLADTEQCLLRTATENRAVCVLRLGGIYGPGRELLKIFGRRAGTVMDGDGKSPSNWIHLNDIVGAIDFARQHCLSGIYNLVQDTVLSRRDLLDRLFQAYDLDPVTWNPDIPDNRPHNVKVSNQKLKDAGYCFVHPDFGL